MTVLNSPNITDKSEEYEKLKPFVGNGLLTALGEVYYNFVILYIGRHASGMDIAAQRIFKLYKINRELTEGNLEPKIRTLLDFSFEFLHERRKYSEKDVRDERNTIIIAGSETSVTITSFVLLMLATFSDIQYKVCEEINEIYCSDHPKRIPITYNDIKSMKLLERVIQESLCLRNSSHRPEMREGWTIPKVSSAVFLIYKLHRSAKYWPRPLVFDADRFLSGKNCSTYFFPFRYGRRICIGQNFAMLNMTVINVILTRRFLIKINNPIGIAEIFLKAVQPDVSSDIIQRTRRESDRVKILSIKQLELFIHFARNVLISAIGQNMDYKIREKRYLYVASL
ncbi:cytochrome P450 4V2-like [Vespa velutina]|uniref:cytochrome P450 4V2-like n=1 Tax=Vespa velutina TaxID=202808 RepID=UPI001FB33F57|nr:cytochrome P450 4V2-like [Vespa velutina]